MASAMASTVVRRLISSPKPSPAKLRNCPFHSSGTKQMAEHGSSGGSLYSNDYIHAPHMYNIHNMTHKRLKMGLFVFGAFSLGAGVPIYAVHYQMKKTGPM